MREMEFLPAWYPQLRQRKRLVVLQVYMSLVLLAGLGLWMLKFNRNIADDRARLAELTDQLQDTQLVLHKLDELEKLDKQLKVQEDVIEKIGLHVEVTRMINAIEQVMSNDMSMLNLSIEVFEQQKSAPASLASLAGIGQSQPPAMDRTLKVKVQGIAPTDVELANFLYQLGQNPLFQRVAMNYTKELTQNGHVMREFEISFSVNLNSQG
jgi:Tfp pilus assembly protein PilN